jgi:hypothetical protein
MLASSASTSAPFMGTGTQLLPWTANKVHIIRSLIFSWGFVALVLYAVMASK